MQQIYKRDAIVKHINRYHTFSAHLVPQTLKSECISTSPLLCTDILIGGYIIFGLLSNPITKIAMLKNCVLFNRYTFVPFFFLSLFSRHTILIFIYCGYLYNRKWFKVNQSWYFFWPIISYSGMMMYRIISFQGKLPATTQHLDMSVYCWHYTDFYGIKSSTNSNLQYQ